MININVVRSDTHCEGGRKTFRERDRWRGKEGGRGERDTCRERERERENFVFLHP